MSNDPILPTGDPRIEAALDRLSASHSAFVAEVRDSFLVLSKMDRRQSALLKDQAEWLEQHETRMKRVEILSAELTEKVHFLLDREMRREGGPEAR